jgi:hypothetical protein
VECSVPTVNENDAHVAKYCISADTNYTLTHPPIATFAAPCFQWAEPPDETMAMQDATTCPFVVNAGTQSGAMRAEHAGNYFRLDGLANRSGAGSYLSLISPTYSGQLTEVISGHYHGGGSLTSTFGAPLPTATDVVIDVQGQLNATERHRACQVTCIDTPATGATVTDSRVVTISVYATTGGGSSLLQSFTGTLTADAAGHASASGLFNASSPTGCVCTSSDCDGGRPFASHSESFSQARTLNVTVPAGALGVEVRIELGQSPADCSPCLADMDGDGGVEIGDLLMFLDAFGANECLADINFDGGATIDDLLDYLEKYETGC